MIGYMGGETSLIMHLDQKRMIQHPWPLQHWTPIRTNWQFYMKLKKGLLQFVLIKPITSLLTVYLHSIHKYSEGDFALDSGYIYISTVNNISISISLYCLVLFYIATQERLDPFRPLSKFLCIKTVIFFSYW